MLVTIKDTTFDDGDYGCIDIGSGRYLASDEKGDYQIYNKPVLMRRKPIEVAVPFGVSVEEIRAFAVDRPESVDFLLIGVLFRSPADGFAWVSGDLVGDDLHIKDEVKGNGTLLLLPPLAFKYPKNKASYMSENDLLSLITREAVITTHYRMRLLGFPSAQDKLELLMHLLLDSFRDLGDEEDGDEEDGDEEGDEEDGDEEDGDEEDSDEEDGDEEDSDEEEPVEGHNMKVESDEDEQVEGHNMELEAHNMNQQAHVNSCWYMEKLNSSLDDCATANCSHCRGMPQTNVWSMEQLKSSLGNCATANCSHC